MQVLRGQLSSKQLVQLGTLFEGTDILDTTLHHLHHLFYMREQSRRICAVTNEEGDVVGAVLVTAGGNHRLGSVPDEVFNALQAVKLST